ncbi:exported hypothetical protein [Nitrospina gracilis 3/211]|uniref:Lipoprotein n=1 Tax=Nitrospina gracilis (strain 3/211) TaxID=1266370 RepID=M1Z0G5_NITG3|nr:MULTISPECIES: hypothetical protein [Nitrospina]MCF8724330.1 hypothetical protein [Nitrospina sp. Nb-3]CCQ91481.1 exported hypothetical protein [Nitrospina gracilis 3/211]
MKNFILTNLIFLFSCSICFGGELQGSLLNEDYLENEFKIAPFNFIKNKKFNYDGFLQLNNYGPFKEIYIFTGKYKRRTQKGHSTFVAILSDDEDGYKKETIISFFKEDIDYLKFDKGKVYIVFKDSSEDFGEIKYRQGQFHYVDMFEEF